MHHLVKLPLPYSLACLSVCTHSARVGLRDEPPVFPRWMFRLFGSSSTSFPSLAFFLKYLPRLRIALPSHTTDLCKPVLALPTWLFETCLCSAFLREAIVLEAHPNLCPHSDLEFSESSLAINMKHTAA